MVGNLCALGHGYSSHITQRTLKMKPKDQSKSQEVGRTWEMAKEGRGGLPRAFRGFVGWGQGGGAQWEGAEKGCQRDR